METLVLSQGYEPLTQISWQRAVTLLFLGKVEVLEEYEDKTIRSATWEIKIPSVVRLLSKVFRKKGVRFSRENVYTRDHGKCQYCSVKVSRGEATYDHVTPRRLGGKTRWENIVICCYDCNQKKGGRTPVQAGMRVLVEPIKPKSLPETIRLTFTSRKTPESWKQYLQGFMYMHGELEQD